MRTIGIEFVGRGEAALVELGEPPLPGPHEVLVETQCSGVTNGTERHALLGEHGYGAGRYPSRHGHQHVGKITAVGEGVERLRVGDWVFYGQYVGHRGWNIASEGGLLVKLPNEVDPKYCALLGVAGVAMRAVRKMGVRAGDSVWVVGQGPIGNFLGQAARAVGARVTVSDVNDTRLRISGACGAHRVLNANSEDDQRALREGGPYDFIFDCCSKERLFFEIFEQQLLAMDGTIGAMAVRKEATFPWSLLHMRQARIEVSCHFQRDDLDVLLHLHQQGLVKMQPVVTHSVSIDDALEIYDQLAAQARDMLGVVFDWG